MKVKTNRMHLYPIYSVSEKAYIDNDFDVQCSLVAESDNIIFTSKPIITNSSIIELLSQSKVKLFFHIECSKTKYRYAEVIPYDKDSKVLIENIYLNGKISISFWIVTQKNLENVSFTNLNSFYEDTKYNIPIYSYIGYSPTYEFYIEKDKEKSTNTTSIFRISKYNENSVIYEPTDNGIVIYLPEQAYESYYNLKGSAIMSKISMLIFPVLVDLINEIKIGDSGLESYLWYHILNSKIEENGYPGGFESTSFSDEDSIVLAQCIFDDLVVKSLEEIKSAFLNGGDDE